MNRLEEIIDPTQGFTPRTMFLNPSPGKPKNLLEDTLMLGSGMGGATAPSFNFNKVTSLLSVFRGLPGISGSINALNAQQRSMNALQSLGTSGQ